MRRRAARLAALAATALAACATAGTSFAAASAGTPIDNRAQVQFLTAAGATTVYSNTVALVVAPSPTRAALTLLRSDPVRGSPVVAATTQCVNGAGLTPLPPPLASSGQPLPIGQALPLSVAATVHGGEAVFLELVDADRNRDAVQIDSVELRLTAAGGDAETVVLAETAVDSGRFVGYVQTRGAAVALGDCALQVERNTQLEARYVDPLDSADTANATALVDPFGVVFDARSGAAVNGARVRLVDAQSGTPARVLGDDGVSVYPAELVTGQAVTDAGGTVYAFPAGVFRFPLVADGNYRLVVEPPPSYRYPSAVPEAQLQTLPTAPYRLSPASFDGIFTVAGQLGAAIDVPLDPTGTALFVDKTTPVAVAAPGDFVPYSVGVRNAGALGPVRDIVVTDTLPLGMRYAPGSTRLESGAQLEPEIGADGRTLTFRVAELAAGERLALRYVTVVAGGSDGTVLVNRVTARAADGSESNAASATVQLREELFSSHAILMGRVHAGTCATDVAAGEGVAGVRVYLEDGRYAVTDAEGKYHFEGLTPGSHVVQIDTITLPLDLEPLRCDTRVRAAQSALSQFVELRGGALGTADFGLARRTAPTGDARLALATEQTDDGFAHWATVTARAVPLADAEVLVMLPAGLEYVAGSARLGTAATSEPLVQAGALRFALGTLPADGTARLGFATRQGGAPARVADLPIQAMLRFTTATARGQRTAVAENVVQREAARVENATYTLSPRFNALQTEIDPADRAEIDRVATAWHDVGELTIEVVGHSDRAPIAARNRSRFPDNYALSLARAQSVADYLRAALPDATFSVAGRGAEEPLALGTDAASLARNRRVEIRVTGVRTVAEEKFAVATASAETTALATTGSLDSGERTLLAPPVAASAPRAAATETIDLATVAPGLAWLQPAEGFAPGVPTTRVAIAHAPEQRIALALDGRPVNALNFEGTETNAAGTVAVSRWRGVDLAAGDNRLVATVVDAAGRESARLERVVRYGGGGVRAELVPAESLLTADGRTQPVIALRVYDAADEPARPGTLGAYRVDPPYRTWWEIESLRENPLLLEHRREPTFAVEDDGLVRIVLEPTVQTGTAIVRLRFNERQEQEIRAWLEPEQRDWILVGVAEGTVAHTRIREALVPPDVEDGYTSDGRLAFFAKGRIKGSTLLTIALDTARERALAEERLFGTIEPDRYYTLYGDAVEQRFEASSTQKLFLKIERRQFAALFGDFETGFTITELGRYGRSLTGFKTDYAGERYAVSAFAAENREAFGRDELRGDGTSGPYRLSRGMLVANSDRLRIEVRDRIRSEVVVESRALARFIDYSLDVATGTLTFKQPVPSRDAAFNPVYIIAEYETLDDTASASTVGARATTRLADERLELGTTLVDEGSSAGDTRLAAADLTFTATGALEVRAEIAQSASADPTRGRASAYLAAVEHVTERLDLQGYIREHEPGFGVGQQLATEAGTRKAGIDAHATLGEHWITRGEAFRQSNLDTGADREMFAAEVRRESATATASIGLRRVTDTLPHSGVQRSELVTAGSSLDVLDDAVTLRVLTEQAPGGHAASLDFPERTTLGVDYHVSAATTVFTEIEKSQGAALDATMTRAGVRSSPWAGTQLASSVNRELGEYGPRVFANVGLTQSWRLGESWSMDVGVDQSETLASTPVERFDADVPLVSGAIGEDFLATFVGGQYRSDLWTFTSRLERRDADLAERWMFVSGFFREPLEGRALSLTTRWLANDDAAGEGRVLDTRFSYAFRPSDSRFIMLNRLDLERDERHDSFASFTTARFVDNLNLHWQLGQRFEAGTQLGARYVESTLDGERYSGWSSLFGVDLRRDLTRLLDVGLHGTWLRAASSGTSERSVGVDLGINAARNLWISVGYNLVGFHDDDFDASRYTAEGPYVRFRFKADQDTFRDLDLTGLAPGPP